MALRNVSMFFRSEPNWSIVEPLRDIGRFIGRFLMLLKLNRTPFPLPLGWRFRKQYYLIASKTDPKLPRHLLSWVSFSTQGDMGGLRVRLSPCSVNLDQTPALEREKLKLLSNCSQR